MISDAVFKLLDALDELQEQGWTVHNQEVFRLTNGVRDLDLWYDADAGWYFAEEEA